LTTTIGAQCLKIDFSQKQLNSLRKQTKRIQHVQTHRLDKSYVLIFNTMSKSQLKTQNKTSQEALHATR